MPVLRIQDLVVPKRPSSDSRYFNGSSPTTSDILWLWLRANARGVFSTASQPSRRDPKGCPRRFPFYFLFKKRQVEMTTLPSRVFAGPWSTPVSSRAKRGIYGAVGPGSLAALGMTRAFVARSCVGSRRARGQFPFYFLFKKRQVEMTTLPSRVFRPPDAWLRTHRRMDRGGSPGNPDGES